MRYPLALLGGALPGCIFVSGFVGAPCGDGILHEDREECDDGNNVDGDGCDQNCFLEEELPLVALTAQDCSIIDHEQITGDDRGGIGLAGEHLFYTGDRSTGRFSLDLSESSTLHVRLDGLISDLATGKLYSLVDGNFLFLGFGGIATSLLEIDPETGLPTGDPIPLSQPIDLINEITDDVGIFSGRLRGVLHTGDRAFVVRFATGEVEEINPAPPLTNHAFCENWAYWGIAEFFEGEIFVSYPDNPGRRIRRTGLLSGETTTLAFFDDISDMCSFIISYEKERWYFHYESSGQFGGAEETVGFCSMNLSP